VADGDANRRLKELEKDYARLKRLVAAKELDIQILKEVAKGVWSLARSRRGIDRVMNALHVSERCACRGIGQH
jgi:hypothetical protein